MTRRRTRPEYKASSDLFAAFALVFAAVMAAIITGAAVDSHKSTPTVTNSSECKG